MSAAGLVAMVAGSPRAREADVVALGRALDSLPSGSLLVVRGRPGVERVAARLAGERGVHVGTLRVPAVEGAPLREAEALVRLRPAVVLAAREGDGDTAAMVRLGRAVGAEVRALGAGRGASWGDVPQTDARAAGLVRRGQQLRFVGFSGSREWRDLRLLEDGFRDVPRDAVVMAGEAGGLDSFAEAMAYLRGNVVLGVAAQWDYYDKQAGFRRNEVMAAQEPDELRAFPLSGGGTAHMIRVAESGCVAVVEPGRAHRKVAAGAVVHCKKSSYDCYVGRGRDPRSDEFGEWGNRYSYRSSRAHGAVLVGSREEAIVRFRADLFAGVRSGRVALAKLAALHGQVLGCWCSPQCCHGEVLEQAAMWALTEQARRLERRVAELTGRS